MRSMWLTSQQQARAAAPLCAPTLLAAARGPAPRSCHVRTQVRDVKRPNRGILGVRVGPDGIPALKVKKSDANKSSTRQEAEAWALAGLHPVMCASELLPFPCTLAVLQLFGQ